MKKILLYCDGSSNSKNIYQISNKKTFDGGFGGCFIDLESIIDDNNEEVYTTYMSGRISNTTNNKMELEAFINGIEIINKKYQDYLNINKIDIKVKSDSNYLIKGINEWLPNWKKNNWKNSSNKTIENLELWKKIYSIIHNSKFSFEFIWVKAHQKVKPLNEVELNDFESLDIYFNSIADKLAGYRESEYEKPIVNFLKIKNIEYGKKIREIIRKTQLLK